MFSNISGLAGKICAFIALLASASAAAQEYPSKPVTLVVPFAPGTLIDVAARVFGREFSKSFGQPVVVDNRPGIAGMRLVKAAPPDGLTLLWHSSSATIAQTILSDPDFDIRRDFVAIGAAIRSPLGIFASSKSGFSSVKEIIDYAKQHPGKLNYGTGGVGTTVHLNSAILASRAGIDMVHIPYKGGTALPTALMSGQIDVMVYDPSYRVQMGSDGRLLALLSKERWSSFSDVPTIVESGGPLVEASVWNGMFAPAGTPADVVYKVNAAIKHALESQEVVKYMSTNGYIPAWSQPEEFKKQVATEVDQWTDAVRLANVPLQ